MNMYARIADGLVAELIPETVDGIPVADRYHPSFVETLIAAPPEVEAGWAYAEGEFHAPEASVPPEPIWPALTARQLRLWLLSQGITGAMVDEAVAQLPANKRDIAQIEWEYSTEYLRSHPLIEQIGAAFSLSPDAIDGAWPFAAAL